LFRFTRCMIRLLLIMMVLFVSIYVVYRSAPVQRFFYPIPHRDYVFHYSTMYELDPYLVAAVIRVESRFLIQAESTSGARGLMQLMPETAKWAAGKMKIEYSPEMLFDPEYNIRMGCWYLRQLVNKFDGNLVVALAAYNGGQGNVVNWLKKGTWNGEYNNLDQVPFFETRDYVRRVFQNYQRYQNLYREKLWW
jgi:soluble lytic murein transglycosylase